MINQTLKTMKLAPSLQSGISNSLKQHLQNKE